VDPAATDAGPPAEIPVSVLARFAHASVDAVAELVGADVLHIKGASVDPALNPLRPPGTDADVLVRPAHVRRLVEGLQRFGWVMWCDFDEGSAFEHAASFHHDAFGMLDVHQNFPGLHRDPAASFAALWADRVVRSIAGRPCPAPGPTGEHLVLLLHAARSPGKAIDVDNHWVRLPADEQEQVRTLAERLGAGLGLTIAVTGEVPEGHAESDLWRTMLGQADPLTTWRARWATTHGLAARARLVHRAVRVNRFVLGERLGRVPTRADVRREWWRRTGAGLRAASSLGRRLR
jgi:hypothetical protein